MNSGDIELPGLLPVRKNRPEEPARARAAEEMLLVRSFFVGIAGGDHHALDADLHHFVEEGAHAVGVGSIEERGVGGDAEARG